ncbi:MAG: CehA/McbA family metallohydrolase [Candidatus Omnitrophota bacterium]|nr:CehA/McbA family metallohydrolase [Candidatus Omnitrophota bacterium]
MLLLGTGCAALPLPFPFPQKEPTPTLAKEFTDLDDGYTDYTGVIHIHTTYSHDAHGKFEDVIRVANAQRLDYVIVTEHNNLRALQEGRQGWYGGTLALVGMELSTRDGHYLAFNVTQEIDRENLTTQQIIDEVNRQGGLGFIAHPYFKNAPWKDWAVTGFTGIEAYNVAHDSLDENRARLIAWTFTVPPDLLYLSLLDRPYDPLRTWDSLIPRHGRVVGIGSSDAHEFHLLGLKFAPYEIMFRFVRTHLLIPSTTLTKEGVYDALRLGHAYAAIELATEAQGAVFMAQAGEQVLGVMGDEVPFQPDLKLTAALPAVAEMTLFRDGEILEKTIGQTWQVPVTQPGVYRLEAMRHAKPWIITNPIYVRSPDQKLPNPETPAEH